MIIKKIGINERAPYNGPVIPFPPKSNHDQDIPLRPGSEPVSLRS